MPAQGKVKLDLLACHKATLSGNDAFSLFYPLPFLLFLVFLLVVLLNTRVVFLFACLNSEDGTLVGWTTAQRKKFSAIFQRSDRSALAATTARSHDHSEPEPPTDAQTTCTPGGRKGRAGRSFDVLKSWKHVEMDVDMTVDGLKKEILRMMGGGDVCTEEDVDGGDGGDGGGVGTVGSVKGCVLGKEWEECAMPRSCHHLRLRFTTKANTLGRK